MNFTQVAKVWLTDTAVWVELKDGRKAQERFADYPRLLEATEDQREKYVLSHFGIHWPEFDEDLSFYGFFHKPNNNIEASQEVR